MDALLLDLDRTLVDVQSFTDYPAAVRDVEGALGRIELVDVPSTDWKSATHQAMSILVALAGQPQRWLRASDLIEQQELAAVEQATAMPGLDAFLSETAGVRRAIVTLLGPRATDRVCDRFGIDVPVRIARRPELRPKPAPDQVLEATRTVGVSPEMSSMIGDSSWDEQAASAAGVRFVGVTNGQESTFSAGAATAPDLHGALKALGR